MIYLIRRILLFSLPFAVYALFIYLTDPYNFLSEHSIISTKVKLRTAYPLND